MNKYKNCFQGTNFSTQFYVMKADGRVKFVSRTHSLTHTVALLVQTNKGL